MVLLDPYIGVSRSNMSNIMPEEKQTTIETDKASLAPSSTSDREAFVKGRHQPSIQSIHSKPDSNTDTNSIEIAHSVKSENDVKIGYSIHSYSSYSADFNPTNILVNKPHDQTSRWSAAPVSRDGVSQAGGTSDGGVGSGAGDGLGSESPWLLIELDDVAVVRNVDFGKYHEAHPCNTQSIKVLGGLTPTHLQELFRGRLRNDGKPERKNLRWMRKAWTGDMEIKRGWEAMTSDESGRGDMLVFPVKYLKIVLGPAWLPGYNASIWHIALHGVKRASIVRKARLQWQDAEALHANRIMLKHLRSKRLTTVAEQLRQCLASDPRTPPRILEHSFIEELYGSLVFEGDYERTEEIIEEIIGAGLMDEYIAGLPTTHSWVAVPLSESQQDGGADRGEVPSSRGGHAICGGGFGAVQEYDGVYRPEMIYLFGGFDGQRALNDLWEAQVRQGSIYWMPLPRHEKDALWPGPRFHHQLVKEGNILYIMGGHEPEPAQQVLETSTPTESYGLVAPETLAIVESVNKKDREETKPNVLWSYNLQTNNWMRHGPPSLGYGELEIDSHSLATTTDQQGHVIYVMGRRKAIPADSANPLMLLRYRPTLGTWEEIDLGQVAFHDISQASLLGFYQSYLLILHNPTLSHGFRLTRSRVVSDPIIGARLEDVVTSTTDCPQSPLAVPTRSFVDSHTQELFALMGHQDLCILPKEGKVGQIYRFSPLLDRWMKVENSDEGTDVEDVAVAATEVDRETQKAGPKVMSKCGHEVVYTSGGHCLSLGSKTRGPDPSVECKMLKADRPGRNLTKRKLLLAIRTQRFLELIEQVSAIEALAYLQNDLHAQVDHSDPQESRELHSLLSHLLQQTGDERNFAGWVPSEQTLTNRVSVFEKVMSFVECRYKQPQAELSLLAGML